MKHLSWTVGLVTLVGSGAYVFVYLYRWEWHRAMLAGVLFLAALVVASAALVLRRLARWEARWSTSAGREDERRVLQLVQSAPVERATFPWLSPESLSRTHIFIPVLLGSGVVLSGLAWLVEHVAGSAARTGVELELAHDLGRIAFPSAALVPDQAEALTCTEGGSSSGLRLLLGPPPGGGVR